MEPYAYREVLEDVRAFVGGKNMISLEEAKAFMGFVNPRAVYRRCKHFVGGYSTVQAFAMDLCSYDGKKGGRRK